MSTKEAKNDVAIEKIADNDVADAKADLKGTKRTADVSVAFRIYNLGFVSNCRRFSILYVEYVTRVPLYFSYRGLFSKVDFFLLRNWQHVQQLSMITDVWEHVAVRKNNRPTCIRFTRRVGCRGAFVTCSRFLVLNRRGRVRRLPVPALIAAHMPAIFNPRLTAGRPAGRYACCNTVAGRRARVPPPLESVTGHSNRVLSSILFFHSGIDPISSSSSCHVDNRLFPMAATVVSCLRTSDDISTTPFRFRLNVGGGGGGSVRGCLPGHFITPSSLFRLSFRRRRHPRHCRRRRCTRSFSRRVLYVRSTTTPWFKRMSYLHTRSYVMYIRRARARGY